MTDTTYVTHLRDTTYVTHMTDTTYVTHMRDTTLTQNNTRDNVIIDKMININKENVCCLLYSITPGKQMNLAPPLSSSYFYLTTWTRAHQPTQLFNLTTLDYVYTIVVLLSPCECVVAQGIATQDMYEWKQRSH